MNHAILDQTSMIVIVKRWYQSIVSTTKFMWCIHTLTDSSTFTFTCPAIWSAVLTLQSKAVHETSTTKPRGAGGGKEKALNDRLWRPVTGSAKQNTTLLRYIGGIMVHAHHIYGQFRSPKAFVPKENSHIHYMWLHGPCVLPEYSGKKKNPNPTRNRSLDVWACGLRMTSIGVGVVASMLWEEGRRT
jgi:hypothetical protein